MATEIKEGTPMKEAFVGFDSAWSVKNKGRSVTQFTKRVFLLK